MPRKKRHEEHVNHEAWAIPYGDLITLLLAFFVVMYAMSSVNEGKYRILADALNAEFSGAPRSLEPVQIGERLAGNTTGQEQAGEVPPPQPPAETQTTNEAAANDPASRTPAEDLAGRAEELNAVADNVESAMANLIKEKMVAVRRHGLWVEVEIQSDILFPSGVASLSPLAVSVLAPLADSLKSLPNPLRVEGHTDNVPIQKREFPSNWELSAARAASVVHLFAKRGVQPSRLTVIGLGEYRPIKSNATAEGRSANRRVVLVILGSNGLPEGTYGHEGGAVTLKPATSNP
jgi:chemotaxis protein MotB